MQHTVLPNVVQNEYMIACNLHSSYIGVNVLEACNMAIVLYSTYSVLLLVSYHFYSYGYVFLQVWIG